MSASPDTVRFDHGTFRASRPAVLPLLVEVKPCHWGWYAEFHGSADELIAAGLAAADMFEIGKSTQRTTRGEFGDTYIVVRKRGKWSLSIRIDEVAYWPTDSTLDPACKGYQKKLDRKRWLEHGGAEAEASVAEIIKRLAAVRP